MRNKIKIKNIIFDLSEVLLTGMKETGVSLQEKHKFDDNLLHKVRWTSIKNPLLTPLVDEFFLGNVSEDEYLEEVLTNFPQIGNREWLKNHLRENFKEIEGTREIILELKKKGYKLALLSLHGKEWVDYCEEKFKIHELFDVISYSFEDKVSKPDSGSFQLVLKKLKASPEECLFIDDSEKNTNAAMALGIKSILFTNAKELRRDLRNILSNRI